MFTVTFWQAHLLSLALCAPQYDYGALAQLQDSGDDQRVHTALVVHNGTPTPAGH